MCFCLNVLHLLAKISYHACDLGQLTWWQRALLLREREFCLKTSNLQQSPCGFRGDIYLHSVREQTTLRVNWTVVIPSVVGLSSQQLTAVKELLTTLPVQASARGKDLRVLEHLCARLTWSQLGCQGEGLTSLTRDTVHFWASGYQHRSPASKQAAFRPVGSKFSLQHPGCLGVSRPSCLKEVFSSVCLSITGSSVLCCSPVSPRYLI